MAHGAAREHGDGLFAWRHVQKESLQQRPSHSVRRSFGSPLKRRDAVRGLLLKSLFPSVQAEALFVAVFECRVCVGVHLSLVSLVMLPPNAVGCLYRINCTDELSRSLSAPLPAWASRAAAGMPVYNSQGHTVFPNAWKVRQQPLNKAEQSCS